MADAKETKTRTFSKKTPDGETLTREVTSPASEVAARYDGFLPDSSGTKATGGSSAKTATSS